MNVKKSLILIELAFLSIQFKKKLHAVLSLYSQRL